MLRKIFYTFQYSLIISCFILSVSCNYKPEPQSLSLSVASTLNLLQENPQFVMYLNFKNMSHTDFWKKNVSDSLLNAEKTFGSLLYTFKLATGASISDGIDEVYYSNSWFGENAIVLRGVLDRNKLTQFISADTLFSVAKNANGNIIYQKNDNGLYFYFRDDNTICASNYLKQIDLMIAVKDSVKSGILLNEKILNSIQNVIYKEDMWMVSTEKIFIRGIFQNFIESSPESSAESSVESSAESSDESDIEIDSSSQNENQPSTLNDSIPENEKISIINLYKRFNSISFSAKMSDELKFLIQSECINDESSKYLQKILSGVISVAKFRSAGNKNEGTRKILEKVKLDRYDNDVFIELTVDENNIKALRDAKLLNVPNQ